MALLNFATSVRGLALVHFIGCQPQQMHEVCGSGTVFTDGSKVYVVTKAELGLYTLLGESDGFNIYQTEIPKNERSPAWRALGSIDHAVSGIPEDRFDMNKVKLSQ